MDGKRTIMEILKRDLLNIECEETGKEESNLTLSFSSLPLTEVGKNWRGASLGRKW